MPNISVSPDYIYLANLGVSNWTLEHFAYVLYRERFVAVFGDLEAPMFGPSLADLGTIAKKPAANPSTGIVTGGGAVAFVQNPSETTSSSGEHAQRSI